jgi:hypothetical protein
VLFFEPGASRRQIGGVHERNRVGLHATTAEQPPKQMSIDPAQTVHADLCAKLMEHPSGWQGAAQSGEAPPAGLLGKLCEQEIERVCAGQQRQEMHPPELRGAQVMPPPASGLPWQKFGNEIVGHKLTETFEQGVGPRRGKRCIHLDL